MGPIICRLLPSGASTSTCRAAATRAVAHVTTRPRSPAAAAVTARQTSRKLTTASSSSPISMSRTTRPPQRQQQPQQQQQRRPRPQQSRPYHSYDHPAPPHQQDPFFSPAERAILDAAYARVPEHGFTPRALALGARAAGYLDISAGVLPDGVFRLVQWHLASQREALAARSGELFGGGEGGEALGVGRKVEMLTWERLMGNRAVVGRLQEALAVMAQPSYVPASLKELARLSDEIWFLAGDTAVDPSWYTKRASLSATYASAELFMTGDHSEGFVETRKFLRRRLDEAQGVGGTLRSLGQWAGFTASAGLNVLRSKGMRV